jgi:hypothetical protein
MGKKWGILKKVDRPDISVGPKLIQGKFYFLQTKYHSA